MSISLTSLPSEILTEVLQLLSHNELVSLARVSKTLHEQLQPVLWTHVDLFPPGFHVHFSTVGRDVSGQPPRRLIVDTKVNRHPVEVLQTYDRLAAKWWIRLEQLQFEKEERFKSICACVQSLCAPLPTDASRLDQRVSQTIWNVFPHLVNLNRLELRIDWDPELCSLQSMDRFPNLLKLSHVRLYGYVPQAFLQYLLRSAPTLQTMDLGLLDEPAPGTDFETVRESSPLLDDLQQRTHDPDDLSMFDDNVAPRPLLWIPSTVTPMPNLTYLSLCRPTEMDPAEFEWGRIHHSRTAEETCLKDWARLIASVSSSLEHLVLDQRPVAHEDALEGADNDEHMQYYSQPSNEGLVEMIHPLLKTLEFPRLKTIDFAGVLVNARLSPADALLRQNLVAVCDEKGIEARFSLSRRCIFTTEDGVVYNTDGIGAEVNEDTELDCWV